MSVSEATQHVLRDFLFCVQNESIPALRQYFPDFVRNGGSLSPDDYRLFPITATVAIVSGPKNFSSRSKTVYPTGIGW